MAQARGSQLTVALFEETAYGVDPGTPAGKKTYVKGFSGGADQELLRPETLNSSRVRSQPDRGNINVAFSLPLELSAENHATILKHALGQNTTTGTNPYTHTITCGALPVGLVVERDFGSNISGSGRYEKFNGCRVASLDIDIPQQGYVSAVANFIGSKTTLGASPLDATLDDTGHTPFSTFTISTMSEGGVAIATIKSGKIRIENDLDEDGYVINPAAPGVRTDLPEGFSTISGEITAVFSSAALLTKALAGTASSLRWVFTRGTGLGSAGNESLDLEVANLIYKPRSPEVSGPKGIVITLGFEGYGATQLRAIVKNAVATI